MITREQLIDEWLDWVNNYLTVGKFAEHRGLTTEQALALLELAREVNNIKHPEE